MENLFFCAVFRTFRIYVQKLGQFGTIFGNFQILRHFKILELCGSPECSYDYDLLPPVQKSHRNKFLSALMLQDRNFLKKIFTRYNKRLK